jgi:hypothetical protein
MTRGKNLTLRLSDEELAWLKREGRPLVSQYRRDMKLLRWLLSMAEEVTGTVDLNVTIKRFTKMLDT